MGHWIQLKWIDEDTMKPFLTASRVVQVFSIHLEKCGDGDYRNAACEA